MRPRVTAINFWQDPDWPTLGDHWGISLEELVHRNQDRHPRGAADELNEFAKTLVAKRSN